jgi:hypothetical protein
MPLPPPRAEHATLTKPKVDERAHQKAHARAHEMICIEEAACVEPADITDIHS